MNIVFLDAITTISNDLDLTILNSLGHIFVYNFSSKDQGILRAENANIVITNKFVIDEECLNHWPKCEFICVAATGYNNVDVGACKRKGIKVSNVRGYSTFSVVQHVFALLFGHLNRTEFYADQVSKGRWQASRDFTFYDHSIPGVEGKVMGVYGLGTIGSQVAKVADAFGMDVIGVSKYPISYKGPATIVNEATLYKQSDILSLHIPLNEGTRFMINETTLHQMKLNGILINTSRGPLIKEGDLASFLVKTPKFTALLDVLCDEPPLSTNQLVGISNCMITPHQAWASIDARKKLLQGIKDNIDAYLKDQPINLV